MKWRKSKKKLTGKGRILATTLRMSLYQLTLFSSPLIQSHKHSLISKTLISGMIIPKCSLLQIPSPNKLYLSFQTICCVTSASSSSEPDESSSSSSTSSIFIKGLPQSVTEGRLRKAFSEFGEVSQAKIMVDKKTKQSLGYGYVWFTREEYAGLAVEEMNGKFFDGRFILVKLGKPGLSNPRRKTTPYKF